MKRFVLVETKPAYEHGMPYARELGFSPVLFTRLKDVNPEVYRNIGRDKFDEVHDLDTHDPATMEALARTFGDGVAGVIGAEDDVMVSAALFAQRLSLPHPALDGLKNTYSKELTRDLLARAGFRQPAYAVIDLDALPDRPPIGFPFVSKPVRDAGALGVYLCRSQAEYEHAVSEVARKRFSRTGLPRTRFLLEDFIGGNFYGAEMLWHGGEWKNLGINRIFVDNADSLCMTGVSHPSDLSERVLRAAERDILEWLRVLGLRGGALNVEFKLIGDRPVLIEVNPRIAGARMSRQIELTSGVAPVKHMVREACGLPEAPLVNSTPSAAFVADALVFARRPGEICEIDTSRIAAPGLIEYRFRKLPFVLQAAEANFETVIGYTLAAGTDCIDAMKNASDAVAQIDFIYR